MAQTPLERRIEPVDVARPAPLFAADGSRAITGRSFVIDGGGPDVPATPIMGLGGLIRLHAFLLEEQAESGARGGGLRRAAMLIREKEARA